MKNRHHPTRSIVSILALALVFALAACGDDNGPTASGDNLTQAETAVMLEALALAGGAPAILPAGASADGVPTAAQTTGINFSEDCAGGGTVDISADVSVTGQGESVSLVQTITHNNCVQTAPSDGSTWTFNGSPSIVIEMTGSVSGDSFTFQGTQTGNTGWSSGSRSGSCSINVSYSVTGSGSSASTTISGTACGQDVSQTVSV